MKSRISFFDRATFKKDITRFAPLWALYAVAMMLIMLPTVSGATYSHPVRALNNSLGPLSIANLLYGALSAQLLFGDLFQSRLCNALHAMPMTREARFLSHVCAGLLFALAPNLLLALLMMPYLGGFWYTSLIWLGVVMLQYLFFLGTGVLSVMCTGSRFAMVLVYAIINFASLVAYWFVDTIYIPLMPGVVADDSVWSQFAPVVHFNFDSEYWVFHFRDTGINPNSFYTSGRYLDEEFKGLGESWPYLLICAGVGIAALIAALVLYRRRKLECAGDFIVVTWLKPIFLVLYSLCAAAFVAVFGELFGSGGHVVSLILGLVIGLFTGRMLLERTIRVFRKKAFLQLAVLAVSMLLSIWAIQADWFGIVSYVPDAEDVNYVVYDGRKAYNVELTEQEHIETVCTIHQQTLDYECDSTCGRSHYYFRIEYHMKDGRVITRVYYICAGLPAYDLLQSLPKSEK